jgi:hypothetical protein
MSWGLALLWFGSGVIVTPCCRTEDVIMLMRTLGGYNIVRLDTNGRRGGEVFGLPFELLP